MKHNLIKPLYHLFAFLSDCTNGFKPFVKYKLVLGALLVGISATGCKGKVNTESIQKEEDTKTEEATCYVKSDTGSVDVEKNSVDRNKHIKPKIAKVVEDTIWEVETMCYDPVIACYVPVPEEPEPEQVYVIADEQPSFPGGLEEMYRFLEKNLSYPNNNAHIQGTVAIQFIVRASGEISFTQVIMPLHPIFDKEAIRVIQSMPRWIPGKINGKPVDVYYILPIRFSLEK